MERLGHDEGLALDVVRLFLADCPHRLTAIKAAIDERSAERIFMTAHALKGSAGNLSAIGLHEAARTLERLGAEGGLDDAPAAWRRLATEAARVMECLREMETSLAAAA